MSADCNGYTLLSSKLCSCSSIKLLNLSLPGHLCCSAIDMHSICSDMTYIVFHSCLQFPFVYKNPEIRVL